MRNANHLKLGKDAFQQRAWGDAYHHLSVADEALPLNQADLKLLANAAYLSGKSSESIDLWSRLHSSCLDGENIQDAIYCAFRIGFELYHQGEYARGGGWFARANTLLEDCPSTSVEHGYLLLPEALQCLNQEEANRALALFEQAGRIGAHFRDSDLIALTQLGRGQALVRLGDAKAGMLLLDEAMAAVDSGDISPIFEGIIYCAVIETCMENFDLKRAHEWTGVLTAWCNDQPQLVPFRGECLVRRAEIMLLRGNWSEGMETISNATQLLTKSISFPATGAAFYQLGEMHRLRGEVQEAEQAFREALQWGRKINPGLSLLRLAQGQQLVAKTSIEVALKEAKTLKERCGLLPACVEIMLAIGATQEAEKAADELVDIGNTLEVPIVTAWAEKCKGMTLQYEMRCVEALNCFKNAHIIFSELGAPYEIAKVRVQIGRIYQALGDKEGGAMEFEAAKSIFQRLKAVPDVNSVASLLKKDISAYSQSGLSRREMEVLVEIAGGLTNKAIAEKLFISERTVERHVSNIFVKLNVSSRSAITAFAYTHQLI